MTHPLFYSQQVTGAQAGHTVELDSAASSHAIRSQRLNIDDPVFVSDGRGTLAGGSIAVADARAAVVTLTHVTVQQPPQVEVHLVQALAKGDRDLQAIEMATEIGVDAVTPWQAQRSISRVKSDRVPKLRVKWDARLQSAAQQARRPFIPILHDVVHGTSVADLHRPDDGHHVVVLHEESSAPLEEVLGSLTQTVSVLHIVVGPEGGLTHDEIEAVHQVGGQTAKIGSNVMRTSTAGPVAITLLNQFFARW